MVNHSSEWLLTQASPAPKNPTLSSSPGSSESVWMYGTIGLTVLLVGVVVFSKIRLSKMSRALKFEEFKNQDLNKKMKLALVTIKKMETNPDLVHSREFNLDYLRMRMDEEVFHYVLVNQIKMKVRQLITVALLPSTEKNIVGVANTGRQIEQMFDVTYEIEHNGQFKKRVLFRVEIKLTKLPTELANNTVSDIITCIENFLCPPESSNWQPSIQGRVVSISWDQKAKPTPLLVLEQSEEGVNVTMKSKQWRSASSNNSNRESAKAGQDTGNDLEYT